ncbi:CPBP family intramembrane metalloprotease [Enterococcus sp. MJM12]|uniref:CPBP family intramembrane metalloprotease n=1 Tax=Candidatus Enterococcus myersii TaxID=2815322 RepID=A0ABS3H6V2_9ENTE|nr:type II CAAX endopeptidase family protein [Enterococcus sp. MJM12]MBO0449186.1 CPBP family intramembrane metalloprotease [Enterococcus sp. MJM12]
MESPLIYPTLKTRIINCLKLFGFIIWAIMPINLSMVLNVTQEKTPIFLRWILVGVWIAFTIFTIKWLWAYYIRHTTDTVKRLRLKDIGIGLLFFILLRIIAVVGTLALQAVYQQNMSANDAALQSNDPAKIYPIYFIIFNVCIGIIAPIIEELVFRGIFTNLLFFKHRKFLPLIVTSVIFSFLHGSENIITFLMYFSIGAVLYLAYLRRRNIADSILVHILNNGLLMIVSTINYVIILLN